MKGTGGKEAQVKCKRVAREPEGRLNPYRKALN